MATKDSVLLLSRPFRSFCTIAKMSNFRQILFHIVIHVMHHHNTKRYHGYHFDWKKEVENWDGKIKKNLRISTRGTLNILHPFLLSHMCCSVNLKQDIGVHRFQKSVKTFHLKTFTIIVIIVDETDTWNRFKIQQISHIQNLINSILNKIQNFTVHLKLT